MPPLPSEECIPASAQFLQRLEPAVKVVFDRIYSPKPHKSGPTLWMNAVSQDYERSGLEKLFYTVLFSRGLQESKSVEEVFLHPPPSSATPSNGSSHTTPPSSQASSSKASKTSPTLSPSASMPSSSTTTSTPSSNHLSRIRTRLNTHPRDYFNYRHGVYAVGVVLITHLPNQPPEIRIGARIGYSACIGWRFLCYESDVTSRHTAQGRLTNSLRYLYGDDAVTLRTVLVTIPDEWDPAAIMDVEAGWIPTNFKAMLANQSKATRNSDPSRIVVALIAECVCIYLLNNNFCRHPYPDPLLGAILNQSDGGDFILRLAAPYVPEGGFMPLVITAMKELFELRPAFALTKGHTNGEYSIELPSFILRAFEAPSSFKSMDGRTPYSGWANNGYLLRLKLHERFSPFIKRKTGQKYRFLTRFITFGDKTILLAPKSYEEILARIDTGPRNHLTRSLPKALSSGFSTSARGFKSLFAWDMLTGDCIQKPALEDVQAILTPGQKRIFDAKVAGGQSKISLLAASPKVPGVYNLTVFVDGISNFMYGGFITDLSNQGDYTEWMLRTIRRFDFACQLFQSSGVYEEEPKALPPSLDDGEPEDLEEDENSEQNQGDGRTNGASDLSSTPSASRDGRTLTHETSSNDGSDDTGDNDAVSIQADAGPPPTKRQGKRKRVNENTGVDGPKKRR